MALFWETKYQTSKKHTVITFFNTLRNFLIVANKFYWRFTLNSDLKQRAVDVVSTYRKTTPKPANSAPIWLGMHVRDMSKGPSTSNPFVFLDGALVDDTKTAFRWHTPGHAPYRLKKHGGYKCARTWNGKIFNWPCYDNVRVLCVVADAECLGKKVLGNNDKFLGGLYGPTIPAPISIKPVSVVWVFLSAILFLSLNKLVVVCELRALCL